MSDHVSSPARRTPTRSSSAPSRSADTVVPSAPMEAIRSTPAWAAKCLRHRDPLSLHKRITATRSRKRNSVHPRRLRRQPQHRDGIPHQPLIPLAHPIPFQHRELRANAEAPRSPVSPDMSERVDASFPPPREASSSQTPARCADTSVVAPPRHSRWRSVAEPVQMRLVPRRDRPVQGNGVHFGEALRCQPSPDRRLNAVDLVNRYRGAAVSVEGRASTTGCSGVCRVSSGNSGLNAVRPRGDVRFRGPCPPRTTRINAL